MINYKKYKWFFTRSGKLVVGGKNADSNDSLLNELKKMRKDLIVMHTKAPGSPFCAIIAPVNVISNEDLHECAVFTGCFSRAWKEGKSSASVHSFKLSQLNKESDMKEGSWNVKGRVKDFIVKLELVITKQNGIVRAVPKQSVSDHEIIATAVPGKIDKIKVKTDNLKVNKEELISALPAGGVKIS
ncbi:MAG: NFACT RNA binding domain-containing protein [Nanoarchaeota archaeon]